MELVANTVKQGRGGGGRDEGGGGGSQDKVASRSGSEGSVTDRWMNAGGDEKM